MRSLGAILASTLLGCSSGGGVMPTATDAGITPTHPDTGPSPMPERDAGAGWPADAAVVLADTYPVPDWTTGAPEAQGLDATKLDEAALVAEGNGSQCLLVIRHGVLVYERYFNGADAASRHQSWSIAKSYSATLVGIAIERGDIHGLDDSVADYVPEWRGTAREAITIRNLVSMTSGLHWSTFEDYVEMAVFSSDHTEFALDLGTQAPPGSSWVYHNGAVQIIEPLFRGATGMTIEQYAAAHLWSRIGMQATWAHDRSGNPTTYANVMATCRDHARFGYLYLHGGRWQDERVSSESWVRQVTTPSQPFNRAYGFLFWLNGESPAMDALGMPFPDRIVPFAPVDLFAARGFGNQFIDVIPSLDMVVVRFGTVPAAAQLASDARFGKHDAILLPILDGLRAGAD